mgnify:CR=1 FL=1
MNYLFFIFFFTQLCLSQDIHMDKKIDIPHKVSEVSGIVFFKGKQELITFNDSGGKPELYILSAKTGRLKRTIKVKNAKNIDWESITADDKFIYVGDTGNNYGNRKNLVIYKISKKAIAKKNVVKAKKIHFAYEDQRSFVTKIHLTNYDCEAITVHKKEIYLFTKNWENHQTNIYRLPLTKGKHIAHKVHQIDIGCLLTSMSYCSGNDTFMGTAYDKDYKSYLIKINHFNSRNQKVVKYDLYKSIGFANQVEGLAWKTNSTLYISREASEVKLRGKKHKRNQKLIQISLRY